MATESSIEAKDVATGSDIAYEVSSSTIEQQMEIPIWHRWQGHFTVDVSVPDGKGDLHLKHPYESSKKGYNRVKLEKSGSFPDNRFQHYKECIDATKDDGDGIDAFTRYHADQGYYSFALERMIDMVEYFAKEGFSVTLTQNVIDAYKEKILDG